jgi:hypothetical protein
VIPEFNVFWSELDKDHCSDRTEADPESLQLAMAYTRQSGGC